MSVLLHNGRVRTLVVSTVRCASANDYFFLAAIDSYIATSNMENFLVAAAYNLQLELQLQTNSGHT